ncbi:hypothetical protein FEM48_Zijuj08G0034600 [Ziziphus jujuba var. spinosa]|uniref:Uncharacterized protein n=1 Tax=Ziziphus jujuba var. spinosa TaxID=714518 RepID=A0A978UWQ8_ZIZJJ|nr:hypothetical protein FEM48_Zijuj08G0034600 [Ziziphus jujuba var. spinosa]
MSRQSKAKLKLKVGKKKSSTNVVNFHWVLKIYIYIYYGATITWYPSQHKAVYRIDDRVPTNTYGDGLYDLTLRPTPSLTLAAFRTKKENQESESDDGGKFHGLKKSIDLEDVK